MKIALGVIHKNGRFLILKRNKSEAFYGFWGFPGGKLKEKEGTEEALKREIKEETGFDVDIIRKVHIIKFSSGKYKGEAEVFLCQLVSGELKLNEEHTQAKWVSFGQIGNSELKDELKEILFKSADIIREIY